MSRTGANTTIRAPSMPGSQRSVTREDVVGSVQILPREVHPLGRQGAQCEVATNGKEKEQKEKEAAFGEIRFCKKPGLPLLNTSSNGTVNYLQRPEGSFLLTDGLVERHWIFLKENEAFQDAGQGRPEPCVGL